MGKKKTTYSISSTIYVNCPEVKIATTISSGAVASVSAHFIREEAFMHEIVFASLSFMHKAINNSKKRKETQMTRVSSMYNVQYRTFVDVLKLSI